MLLLRLTKLRFPVGYKHLFTQLQKCHSVFGIENLSQPEKAENFTVLQLMTEAHDLSLDLVKQYYLSEHILVRSRNMKIDNDQALDEYILGLLRQDNSLIATTDDDTVAGICVNYASRPEDLTNLRQYASYRQDPNIKDLLKFIAKMQEITNLWEAYKQEQIFEIKMLTVMPEFRRQGLAVALVEKSLESAYKLGFNIIRMDCVNHYDYKIAERCMLKCIASFPIHKVRGEHASFIMPSSEYNVMARIYVASRVPLDVEAFKDNPTLSGQDLLIR